MSTKLGDFELVVCSDSEHDDLIAEISYRGQIVAVLSQDQGFDSMQLTLMPKPDGTHWSFGFDQFVEIVSTARKRLWELRKGA